MNLLDWYHVNIYYIILYIEAFALHKKYGGKGIHYIGGYNTSTSNTLFKKDGGNVTTQEVVKNTGIYSVLWPT